MNLDIPSSEVDNALAQRAPRSRAIDIPGSPFSVPDALENAHDFRADIVKILGLIFKHKILVLAILSLALLLGMVATMLTTRIYSGYTTVKIDRSAVKILKDQSNFNDPSSYDPQFYQTQYEILKSRMLAQRIVTALDLGNSDFVGGAQPSLMQSLMRGNSPAPKIERTAAELKAYEDAAVGQILGGLTVRPVPFSSIVSIGFTSSSPQWAQRISIAVAEQFARLTMDMRYDTSNYARSFLEERLQQLKLKLEASEKELLQYAQKEGIVDQDNKQPQVTSELQGIQNAYSAAVANRVTVEQTWRQAEADGGASLPQVMSDATIQAARTRLAQFRAAYQDKLTLFKPSFPEMMALQSQINSVDKDIKTQINLIKSSLKAQYDAALANERALGEKLKSLREQALDLRGRSIDYTILQRDVDTNRSLYDGLLQQFSQLGIASDVESNNISIIDKAILPSYPDKPNLSLNLLIAFLLGLVAAGVVVAVIEVLDDTFKSPEEMEEQLGVPALGVTPMFNDPNKEKTALTEVQTDPTSPLAEAYRSLRTAIQFSTSDGAPRSLLVTSSRPGEGKSTTSACLALNFAQLGMRVLLIDADMRNPSLHRNLKIDNSSGLSNYLAGTGSASMVKNCGMENVVVMTTGPLPPNPAELLAGPRFGALLSKASSTFEIVIIDGPPIMGLADAPILSAVAEGTILLVEGGKTPRNVVKDALKRLNFARGRVIGGLLNKYDPGHGGAGYGYGYNYSYGYGAGAQKYIYGETAKSAIAGVQDAAKPGA